VQPHRPFPELIRGSYISNDRIGTPITVHDHRSVACFGLLVTIEKIVWDGNKGNTIRIDAGPSR
jgi:hypothetical protein